LLGETAPEEHDGEMHHGYYHPTEVMCWWAAEQAIRNSEGRARLGSAWCISIFTLVRQRCRKSVLARDDVPTVVDWRRKEEIGSVSGADAIQGATPMPGFRYFAASYKKMLDSQQLYLKRRF